MSYINISNSTIVRAILILSGFWFLYLIREVLILLLVAGVIAAALGRLVDWFEKKGIPRFLAAIFLYLVLLLVFVLVISLLLPPLVEQIKELIQDFPQYLEGLGFDWSILKSLSQANTDLVLNLEKLTHRLREAAFGLIWASRQIFGGLVSGLAILVISFYLVLEEKKVKKLILSLVPGKERECWMDLIEKIQKRVGQWLLGQIFLGIIVGVLIYFGLKILGVNYALVLALLAGILEIVPWLGPILAAGPAVFFALWQSPVLGLLVLVWYTIVQQIENHLIVPQVMRKATGLDPILVILALLIGAKLAGVLGMILAVPTAAGLKELWQMWSLKEGFCK